MTLHRADSRHGHVRPRKKIHKSKIAQAYDKLAAWKVESLFIKKEVSGPPRTVFINEDLPPDYFDHKGRIQKEHVYASNQVITSKYNIVTFLPRNLLEQFRRIANVFFAFIAILQFFRIFSTISPGLVILPLIVVLGITAIKDGYEDIKRHQSDREVNLSRARVLNGGSSRNTNVSRAKGRSFAQVMQALGLDKKTRLKNARAKQKEKALAEAAVGTTQPEEDPHREPELVPRGAPPAGENVAPSHDELELHEIEFDHDHDPTLRSSIDVRPSQDAHHRPHFFHRRDPTKPHWRRTAWEDVRVGDFVKIVDEEAFPADILICSTSEEENVCYVETKNLDGETNLKSRNAVPMLADLRSADDCADANKASFRIELDRPDPNMYKLNGAVEKDGVKQPIDLQTVLLRGTVLKNTKWVIGVVMYTGSETKIMLNAGGTPSKRSKVERQMNPQVFVNLLILAGMAVACGVLDHILEKKYYPKQAPWMIGAHLSDDNPNINGLITAMFALITFQNIVPISLYISIEFVRTLQAAFIYFDKDLWYEKTDQPTLARSWNLSDDLGQIEYVFSDKTGTLTQNVMLFRNCSIGGKVYRGDFSSEEKPEPKVEEEKAQLVAPEKLDVRLSATSTTVEGSGSRPGSSGQDPEKRGADVVPEPIPQDPIEASGVELSPGVETHFRNDELVRDLSEAVHAGPESENASQARTLNGFFTVLSLCHTVIASVDSQTGKITYRAQSPDESALVQAAADMGYVFRGRDREILRLQTPFSEEVELYELLNVLDFTSARKRMSVLVRKLNNDDSRIFLLTKGADNVIFERLKPAVNDELKEITGRHLDDFASEGLRTLTLAYKVVSEEYYDQWAERYSQATVDLDDRDAKTHAVCEEIETELRLLGATAIEDRLQDGVPETIADLKLAGIKVWVLTGDKLETAIAIGYSTNLIATESNLIVVRGDEQNGLSVFDQMYNACEQFFPEAMIIEEEGLNIHEKHGQLEKDAELGHGLKRVNTGVSSIVGPNNGERPGGFVLVIEGMALNHAFADEDSKRLLLRLSMECEAVICCRVSPLQKALVVKLIKEGLGTTTLAIGDGANDVSMIQAADVGVGIIGEEGLQAVNSSDYAIAQFRFLKRLILVHGHWSYARNGNMIVNFFYKNIICIGCLFWFMFFCAWSSQYVFEYTYLLWWNVFWSIAPVIAIGLFDRIADDDILMELPELYRYGREGYWFNFKTFSFYMFEGVVQSAIIYFLMQYGYFSPTARSDGYDVAQYEWSTTMVIGAVMVANLFNGLNTEAWTAWVFFAVFLGIVLVWAYTAIYSLISPGWFYVPVYGNYHYLFRSALFWFSIPLVVLLALLPGYLLKAYKFNVRPTEIDKARWVRKLDPSRKTREQLLGQPPPKGHGLAALASSRRPSGIGSRTDMATGIRSAHRGFDFAQEEGGVAIQRIQTNLSERRVQKLEERKKKGSRLRLFSLGRKDRARRRSEALSTLSASQSESDSRPQSSQTHPSDQPQNQSQPEQQQQQQSPPRS